jgi:phosphate-selective porin OprO/OprP
MTRAWTLAFWCLVFAPIAGAQGTIQEQLDALKQQVAAQQATIDAQAEEIKRLRGDVDQSKLTSQDSPKLSMTLGRPSITSADGENSVSLRAVVQLDGAVHDQTGDKPLAQDFRRGSVGAPPNRENNGARDLSDGAYFRRARIGAEGYFMRDFGFKFLGEFGGAGTEGPTRINDAWINYMGEAPFLFQVGAFAPPANLDDGTTPEDLVFLERASASELSRTLGGADGRIGANVRYLGPRAFASLALTTRTAGDAEVFDSALNLVGRAAVLALTSPDYNLHVGASGTWALSPADQGRDATGARYPIRFRDRPEIRVDSTRLIDTGSIDADSASAIGVELAGNWRNFYLQGENYWFAIDRRPTTAAVQPSNPRFGGYYVQGSWVITGEPRRYNMTTASFQSPRPYSPVSWPYGFGAWEIGARFSHMNLNFLQGPDDTAASGLGVRGGEQNIWTVGVNWYLSANLKVMFDWLHIRVDRLNPAGPGNTTPFGPAPATPPLGVQIGQDLDVFAARAQFAF